MCSAPRDTVRTQPVCPLESDDRLVGFRAENSVSLSGQIAEADQPALQVFYLTAGGSLPKGSRFCRSRCSGGLRRLWRTHRHGGVRRSFLCLHAVQLCLGLRPGRTVHRQTVHSLEGSDGCFRLLPVIAVRRACQIAQIDQRFLQKGDGGTAASLSQRNKLLDRCGSRHCRDHRYGCRHGGCRNGRRRRRVLCQRVAAEKDPVGIVSGDPVILQAVCRLEFLQGAHAQSTELAIHIASVIAELLQALLDQLRILTGAVPLHFPGGDRIGRHGSCSRSGGDLRRFCRHGGQGGGRKQGILCRSSGDSVSCQPVLFLESDDRLPGGRIESARNASVIVSQLCQLFLQLLHVLAGRAVAKRPVSQ